MCISCSRIGSHFCASCQSQLVPYHRTDVHGLDELVCVTQFGGWARDAIIRYKEGDRQMLSACADVIGDGLPYVRMWNPQVPLVPIPSQQTKRQQRGYDTVRSIVGTISRNHNVAVCDVLTYRREVRDQVGLTAHERRDNVRKCFAVVSPCPPTVLLVDDVATTGATLSEAAKTLRKSGASKVLAIVMCS